VNDQTAAMAKDAAIRGASIDPSLAQTASDAANVRQQMLAGYGSAQAATGAARSQYADTLAHVVAPTQELQARAQAANRVSAVGDKLTALSQREGAAKANYVAGRTADEAKSVLSKQALGLDITKAQQGAAVDAANIDIKRGVDPVTHKKIVKPLTPTAEKTKADLAFFKQHGYYPPTGPPKLGKGAKGAKAVKPTSGPGSLNAGAESKIVSQVNTVAGLIKSSPKVDDKGKPLTDQQIRQHLLNGTNPTGKPIDPTIVNLAFDIARRGGLSPANVTAAHNVLNIHVGKHFKVLPKPKAAKVNPRPGPANP
jgi:hypothetical protein